jgi:AhpD family alkylhydroperoxidase
MTSRVNPFEAHFDSVKPLIDFGNFTHEGLDSTLAELIRTRASQLNGCAACLFMHTREARTVREAEPFLRRIVTRLCLDVLKSAKRRRETYIGPWLPEPIVDTEEDDVDDVTPPLMVALERLSPLERAAFLLHDVFGVGFDEVAETIGLDSAACRQLASRARAHVRAENMSRIVRYGLIDGLPGFVTVEGGDTLQTTALEIVDGEIAGIYIVRNPDKLRHLGGGAAH